MTVLGGLCVKSPEAALRKGTAPNKLQCISLRFCSHTAITRAGAAAAKRSFAAMRRRSRRIRAFGFAESAGSARTHYPPLSRRFAKCGIIRRKRKARCAWSNIEPILTALSGRFLKNHRLFTLKLFNVKKTVTFFSQSCVTMRSQSRKKGRYKK